MKRTANPLYLFDANRRGFVSKQLDNLPTVRTERYD